MKTVTVMMMSVFLFAGVSLSSAQGPQDKMMKMCPMHGMMMHSMMSVEVTTTPDGGVIILNGSKLTKYDSGLNVVKEIQIQRDTTAMQQFMAEAGQCPMCQKMMSQNVQSSVRAQN